MKHNILENLAVSDKEIFQTIAKSESVRIERIISNGQMTAEDFWYDQEEYEFVMLIEGKSILRFENKTVELKNGDYVLIKPHEKHRVEYTSKPAVWLCIFFK